MSPGPALEDKRSVRPGKDRERAFFLNLYGERTALQRTYSLKKNAQFKYVHRRGVSAGSHEMVMLYVRAKALKVGFSVGKKLGCAVARNRVKRRLRAAIVPLLPRMKPGLYVFIARQPAATADFERLRGSMQYLLRRQNLLVGEGKTGESKIGEGKKAPSAPQREEGALP